MRFENFFLKKEHENSVEDASEIDELSEEGKSRRNFLRGGGALLAASALGGTEAFASSENALEKKNIEEAVRAYETFIQQNKDALAQPDAFRYEIWNMLLGDEGLPNMDQETLRGTEFDREAFFREGGSWPAAQLRRMGTGDDERAMIRLGHHANKEDEYLAGYGNGFFSNDTLIANRHVMETLFQSEYLPGKEEIAGSSVFDLIPDSGGRREVAKVDLDWDRKKANEDIHGKLVHVPYIHEERGREKDGTGILSGVVFKITPNFLTTQERESLIGPRATQEFGEILQSSYAFLIRPRDTNNDFKANAFDLEGISGSPVFLDSDCEDGERIAVGIEWGALDRTAPNGEKYTLVLLHGPEVLGRMHDTVNTILSEELSENDAPQKRALTEKVQMALHEFGFNDLLIDGLYGKGTSDVVFDFQLRMFSREEIESSIIPGVVDRLTWNALFPEEQNPDKKKLWFG
jgi:hypothetical protein